MDKLSITHENLPLRSGKFTTERKVLLQNNQNPNSNSNLNPNSLTNSNLNPNSSTKSGGYYNLPPEDRPLTHKQKMAVEYLINGLCKTKKQAALKAGYTLTMALAASSEIFAKPNVKKEYNRRRKEVFAQAELTTQTIVDEFVMMAEANIADYTQIQEDGSFRFNLNDLSREQMGVIKEIGYDALGRPKLILHDRRSCYLDIAKLKGFGSENNRFNSINSNSLEGPLTLQQLDAIIARSTTNNIQINQQINVSSEKQVRELLPERQSVVIEQITE